MPAAGAGCVCQGEAYPGTDVEQTGLPASQIRLTSRTSAGEVLLPRPPAEMLPCPTATSTPGQRGSRASPPVSGPQASSSAMGELHKVISKILSVT